MQLSWHSYDSSVRIHSLARVTGLLFIAAYAFIYWTRPFSDLWNVIVTNFFLVAAASTAATLATMTWARYERQDNPRRLWGFFATGLWLWAVAEGVWGYLNVTLGEVPAGTADLFWISAYLFFGVALVVQYRILARPNVEELTGRVLIALLSLLILGLLIFQALTSGREAQNNLTVAINAFYPAADLIFVFAALWMARNFMGGAFARPWLGLLAFSIADLMYAWLEISGVYSWSVNQANLLTTLSDIVYLGSYLVLALGVLSQWAFLKYGMRSPAPAG